MSENKTYDKENTLSGRLGPWQAPFTYDAAHGYIHDAHSNYVCVARSAVSDEHNALIAVALSAYAALEPKAIADVSDLSRRLIAAQRHRDWGLNALLREAAEALSVPSATLPIPEGWKLVPEQPTETMLDACITLMLRHARAVHSSSIDWEAGYKALLDAAPSYIKEKL